MAEPLVVALVAALLLAGAACGYGEYLLRRTPGLGAELAKTLAMTASLGLATAGCAAAVAAAVTRLADAAGCGVGEGCTRAMTVARLPAPVHGVPEPDLTLRVDGLAALFVVVIGCCAAAVAVYSIGWLRDDPLRHGVAGTFNLFVAAMLFAVVVSNVLWLFVALELITLCGADLIRRQGHRAGSLTANRTALRTFLLVSHGGLICLLAGLLPVVVGAGQLDFEELGKAAAAGHSPAPAASFALVLLGLGIRAGVTPFHFWVPTVHPQLPTNMHAIMSAVLLKIPVYLMIRFFCGELIGPVQWWWGVTLLVLAGVTAVVTVFYALLGKDLKTVLAYHSVENIGIILAGVGMALLFSDRRFDPIVAVGDAAALALLASLFHTVNHALFKTLLFLGTGSIERRTGTVETAALGGLLRLAPWTGITFLVGAIAIAGLPPLNGFVSEWLTLQALFGGQALYRDDAVVALTAMAALVIALVTLALAFAITALAFLKIVGEALLGAPHGNAGNGAGSNGETWSMRVVLAALAAACLLIGLQPGLLVPWLSAAVRPLGHDVAVLDATAAALTIELPSSGEAGAYRAVLPILPLVLLAVVPLVLTAGIRAAGWVRRPVWVGGEPFEPRRMQYTGGAVTALLWYPLSGERAAGGGSPLPAGFQLAPRRGVAELTNRFYNRLVAGITDGSQRFGQRFQNGDIRSYLLYIFAAVALVLVALAVSR